MRFFFWLFIILCFWRTDCEASSVSDTEEDAATEQERLIDLYDFSEVQKKINESFSKEQNIDFKEMVENLVTEGISLNNTTVIDSIVNFVQAEIVANKNSIFQIVTLAIFCAILTNLTSVFQETKVSELGFQVVYMCIVSFLLNAFQITYQLTGDLFGELISFMRALMPAYLLSFAYTGGSVGAVAYYEICLMVISIVEWVLAKIMLPMLQIYVSLLLLNSLSQENLLKRMAQLLKTLLDWGLKTIMAAVIGIQVLQNLLLPYIDALKGSVVHRAIYALPGVGNTIGTFADMMIGSGILVKNAIGVTAILIIGSICIVPIIKLVVITVMYMFTAAILEPISDTRLTEGISGVCDANRILLKITFYGVFLFVLTLALICAAGSVML